VKKQEAAAAKEKKKAAECMQRSEEIQREMSTREASVEKCTVAKSAADENVDTVLRTMMVRIEHA
jgi:hypothetical protein